MEFISEKKFRMDSGHIADDFFHVRDRRTEWRSYIRVDIWNNSLHLFLLVIGGVDFYLYYRRHRNLQKMQEIVKISVNALDMPKDQIEEDYQKLLQLVHEDKVKAVNDLESGRKDMAEYYTMWVHQIKTPIAAMRLLLQSEDTPKSRECAEELFHIEQYVEMALHYSRLDSDTTDFVIQKNSLDEIVREAVRKYAKLFIRKKNPLRLPAVKY